MTQLDISRETAFVWDVSKVTPLLAEQTMIPAIQKQVPYLFGLVDPLTVQIDTPTLTGLAWSVECLPPRRLP